MPAMITLAQAKAHARIDTTAEDALLQGYLDAAVAYVAQAIGVSVDDLDDTAPEMAKQAALLVFGDFYAHREGQSERPLSANPAADALLAMCRNYSGFVQ